MPNFYMFIIVLIESLGNIFLFLSTAVLHTKIRLWLNQESRTQRCLLRQARCFSLTLMALGSSIDTWLCTHSVWRFIIKSDLLVLMLDFIPGH